MKRRVLLILLVLLLLLSGCGIITDEKLSPSTNTLAADTYKYKINLESDIHSDLDFFGIEAEDSVSDLALSDLCAIFPDGQNFYLYFKMPRDNDNNAYRVSALIMNENEYQAELCSVDGCFQKYAISNVQTSSDDEYEITEINIYNENKENDTYAFNINQLCTVKLDDVSFYFNQEHRYHIVLKGQLFESIYQFNKDKNIFQDLWGNIISNPSYLDEDLRSFFYFAFDCYDIDRGIEFCPDDILQLDVEYTQNSFTYQGKDRNQAENIAPQSKAISESITPDTINVISDGKYSNRKIYQYDRINRLSDANLAANSDQGNASTLQYAANKYDWAVQFGDRYGYEYRYLAAGIFKKNYDIAYTQIEDFNAISILYRYEGQTFHLNTAALVADQTTEVIESVQPEANHNVSAIERFMLVHKNTIESIIAIAVILILLYIAFRIAKYKIRVKKTEKETDFDDPITELRARSKKGNKEDDEP